MTAERPPTIADVAAVAGVSRGTVSRVLRGGDRVSLTAQRAVRQAIDTLGYTGNAHARSLSTGRSDSIAFLLSETEERLFADPTFSVLLRGLAKALAPTDLALTLLIAGDDAGRERAARFLSGGHVDAIVHVSAHENDPISADLVRCDRPVVVCGRPLQDHPRFWGVRADDCGGARHAVRHLKERGCRHIATITGALDSGGGQDRLRGYLQEVGEDVRPELIVPGDYTATSAVTAVDRLLTEAPDLDGLFVGSDLMARAALVRLRDHGRRVPEHVKVVGFDDLETTVNDDVGLTSVRQPIEQICTEIVRAVHRGRDGEDPVDVILPTRLICRSSS
ncbi:LacI family DNA-binding transcriptional regulator [Austwickia sp. TVS 96-490-7B]|uniref:LacI family DNA-binding transcriptional regulator n=1 Tax=Austwickia sp. TVS 96-490-7B TaxID=2830843 RepID=UPI001C55D5B0|nr:LacI family DNA-binding transcriptional regulator [Austwickia sp. TVS 96-490-7B]